MDKSTLEHIAPYLAYGVKVKTGLNVVRELVYELSEPSSIRIEIPISYVLHGIGHKLLLRPLSDLTKEIEHNGERFLPMHRILEAYCFDVSKMSEDEIFEYVEPLIQMDISYMTVKILCEWHFDFQDLIAAGLAVDINTLKDGK